MATFGLKTRDMLRRRYGLMLPAADGGRRTETSSAAPARDSSARPRAPGAATADDTRRGR
ncbi:hypothetical protein [Polycyclovorans algicola]|uniref:hypothetical protein n=1 Tax=Polycyclovorans algicola TaxID=616992 RepID=UPI0012685EA2|nr:hypothetical protein [Polycyclovorans algicola]